MNIKIITPHNLFTLNYACDMLIDLEYILNGSDIQPLFLYSDSTKKIKQINNRFGIKNLGKIDYNKINEDIIVVYEFKLFEESPDISQKWRRNILKEDILLDFLKNLKKVNKDVILLTHYNTCVDSVNSVCEQITDDVHSFTKMNLDMIKTELIRFIRLKYLTTNLIDN
jgi:hypothetical protein